MATVSVLGSPGGNCYFSRSSVRVCQLSTPAPTRSPSLAYVGCVCARILVPVFFVTGYESCIAVEYLALGLGSLNYDGKYLCSPVQISINGAFALDNRSEDAHARGPKPWQEAEQRSGRQRVTACCRCCFCSC